MDDIEKAIGFLTDVEKGTSAVCQQIQLLLDKAEKGELCTSKGLSFLEMKYQMLLSYLINLTYILLQKSRGQSIQTDPAIFRLTEIRTVLEKLRPIDQKLKYQIDKLIRTVITGDTGLADPLRFKANPDNLINKLEGEDSEEDSNSDEEEKERKPRAYVPPKLAAVHYDGDETIEEKKQRHLEKAQRRAASSSLVRELAHQLTDAPEEIQESRDLHRLKADKRAKEIKEYEEQFFTRVSVSKKERNASRRLSTMSSLNSLTQFDDISALMGDKDDFTHQDGPSRKKQKLSGKGKKGKKGGFKKKKRKF
ncbi:neuroguidin-like [Ylistrum balloti]|uniref:neuroguidin-like n=1 Tax=Ylistrum balloti TaxID=509963 RepID=UPI00290587FD|nr:neuroguidin-like [Ylistrum balloti]XP_060081839.1 neuroguidin-like [Ylistrum balloti]